MFGKKKAYGQKTKVRTLDEINRDYQDHALQLGHKTRVLFQLQQEIEEHTQRLCEINEESKHLPPEAKAPAQASEEKSPA